MLMSARLSALRRKLKDLVCVMTSPSDKCALAFTPVVSKAILEDGSTNVFKVNAMPAEMAEY
jgi:hypothetical protein